ncbi:hypothetical protein A2U01_0070057, partial [Trifolium medium]|nr:hypothetical protein [Trifolium medium]
MYGQNNESVPSDKVLAVTIGFYDTSNELVRAGEASAID